MPKDDFVQRINAQVDSAIERVTDLVGTRLDKLIPHGLTDEPVSQEDELREYVATVANHPDPVSASVKLMNDWAQKYSLSKARSMYADYVGRNERRMAKLLEKNNDQELPTISKVPEQEY